MAEEAETWLHPQVLVPHQKTGRVIIAWTPATGATSYNIYWSTAPGVTLNNGTKISDAENPYTHTGLANGTTYYYVVTATYSNGESGASTEVSGTPEDTSHPVVLDDTFGVDGIALLEIVAPIGGVILQSRAYDIAIQADGKIVAAGSCGNNEAIWFAALPMAPRTPPLARVEQH